MLFSGPSARGWLSQRLGPRVGAFRFSGAQAVTLPSVRPGKGRAFASMRPRISSSPMAFSIRAATTLETGRPSMKATTDLGSQKLATASCRSSWAVRFFAEIMPSLWARPLALAWDKVIRGLSPALRQHESLYEIADDISGTSLRRAGHRVTERPSRPSTPLRTAREPIFEPYENVRVA